MNNPLADRRWRAIIWQVLVIGAVLAVGWYLVVNTLDNLARQRIATGFGFLDRQASFVIGEHLIDYGPTDSYARAILAGLVNTLAVAGLGIVLATILGTLAGIARLSGNWLVARLAGAYVEVVRNIPLLLQLFFWYGVITISLPGPRQALNPLPGVFLSNRGLRVPVPADDPVWTAMTLAVLVALVLVLVLRHWAGRRQAATGQPFPVLPVALALVAGLPLAVYLLGGAPTALDMPALGSFNFQGGAALSPEFAALLFGLTVYTAAFIADIVRSGILSVDRGQIEAAQALGLNRWQILRFVVLPQALRLIVPPLTSQYLALTKNSSLAVAIGYPDVVAVLNTTINQTGQAIEGVALIMAVYLTLSLGISAIMNWYNQRIARPER